MPFHTRQFDTYCILGDPAAAPVWNWSEWSALLTCIDPIVSSARGRPAVRSNQYLADQKGTVKFGRIGWNEKGHHKWTHKSPANAADSETWRFLNAQIWAPSWTICERENRAPDVFLEIANESFSGGFNEQLSFNPVIILAVSIDLSNQIADQIRTVVDAFVKTTHAKLSGFKRRPWGTSNLGGFTNAIQDLCISGLFKAGPRHSGNVDFNLLADDWDQYAAQDAT